MPDVAPPHRIEDQWPTFVLGAGQMGAGIAQVFICAGFRVGLSDVDPHRFAEARDRIEKSLARRVQKGEMAAEAVTAALSLLVDQPLVEAVADYRLVIEAATEREETKHAIFREIGRHIRPGTILTTNTSSISITRLATLTADPGTFMGLHFMNPVPAMRLVELIRGFATSDETFQTMKAIVERIGKTAMTSEDYSAFIVNRILIPMINEAVYTLFEGVGTVASIDAGLTLGANHPMGPFQLADLIGLDTCLAIMTVLHDGLADTKYRPCPLLVKYVEAGWLGRKTGRGFYDYRSDPPQPTR